MISKAARKRFEKTEKGRASKARYRKTDKYKRTRTNYRLMKQYGITLERKEQMWTEQKGLCGLCGLPLPDVFAAHTDHNHQTGEIRKLLHVGCNVLIGRVELMKDQIFEYLKWEKFDGVN